MYISLALVRLATKASQSAIADKVGVSLKTYFTWETGKATPRNVDKRTQQLKRILSIRGKEVILFPEH